MIKTGVLMVMVLTACSSLGYGQDAGTIGPDRPNFSIHSHTVPAGQVQLEGGAGRRLFGSTSASNIGELLVRVGLSDRVEFRTTVPSYRITQSYGNRTSGAGDSLIEGKFLMKSGDRGALAFLATAILPSGTRTVSEHRFQPGATMITDVNVSKKFIVTTNVGYFHASFSGQRYHLTFAASTLGLAVTSHVRVFSEIYALKQRDGWLHRYTAAGTTWTINKSTAVDLSGGVGLANHAHGSDHYYSIGISHLF